MLALKTPQVVDDQHQKKRQQQACENAQQPLKPIEKRERLQREKDKAINKCQNQREQRELAQAKLTNRRKHLVVVTMLNKQLKQIRLYGRCQRHGRGGKTWGIGEDVNAQAQQEAPYKHDPFRRATPKGNGKIDIQQRCGHAKKVDVVEHQRLNKHQPKEKQQTFQEINIHPFTFSSYSTFN